jgi:ABC-type multidrug transport system ATPase subunit
MYVNGQPLADRAFQRLSEYVQHDDVFVPTQTLREALLYHAHLRLGPDISRGEKEDRIGKLVQEAGLGEKLPSR